MTKPNTLKDLLADNHITLGDANLIASGLFDGETVVDGPDGYVVTLPKFTDLPSHVQGFIIKAVLESSLKNIFDAADEYDDIHAEEPDFDPEETEGADDEEDKD